MAIHSHITDSKTQNNARVDATSGEQEGLVVATRPLKIFENTIKTFSNPTYGTNLNVAVAFSPNPEVIYQENAEWTTSSIAGTWIFDSNGGGVVTPQAGSNCIDARDTVNDDIAQFDKTSNLVLTNYVAITGYINLTAFSVIGTKGISIYGWDTATGTQVGNAVGIENYIDTGVTLTWQQFSISLSDLNLTGKTIDSIRIQTIDIGGGPPPDYFLDNLQIEKIGSTGEIGPQEFSIEPTLGTWLHVYDLSIFIADNDYSMILTNSTAPLIPYNSFLGLAALSSGINYQHIQDNVIKSSIIFKQLSNFLILPNVKIASYGTAGATNSWVLLKWKNIEPIILKSENQDKLKFIVSDDLSSLDIVCMTAACKIETRK